ncbi:MAG: Rne/Rng family ribonuclease [Alistipes sp.]|nr:Rne/Rng family ribonuclease [Candidatus Alistipes equi]
MSKEIFISVSDDEMQIAQTYERRLEEFAKEQLASQFSVGDVYIGSVHKIMPGLNAAFIDIGSSKDAFIHYADLGENFLSFQHIVETHEPRHRGARVETMKLPEKIQKDGRISQYLVPGQKVMVQISKEAISTKGPRLTADISLPGRNIVLLPFCSKIMISQKIRSNAQKKRLRCIAEKALLKNFGVIIRTAAENASDEDVTQDILSMLDRWKQLCQSIRKIKDYGLLLREINRATAIIRDNLSEETSQIVVDDADLFDEIKGYIHLVDPKKEACVKLYKGSLPLFDNFDITRQIKSLFSKYVSLKRGAYLIIESTEAMNVIDVNSGNRTKAEDNQEQTATDVNLLAAQEVARQLRLRDMGGIIIIDFIDMRHATSRQLVYDEMRKLMSTDKAPHTILPLTKFGLMQITRQRLRPLTVMQTEDVCPTCGGTGKVEPIVLLEKRIENQLSLLTQERGYRSVILHVSPYVGAYLKRGIPSIRMRWQIKFRCLIRIRENHSLGILDIHYKDARGKNLL